MRSHSFVAESAEHIITNVQQAMAEGFTPTVGIMFTSVSLDARVVAEALADVPFPVFGATTCGEILAVGPESSVHERSAVVSLLEMDASAVHLRTFHGDDGAWALGRAVAEWSIGQFDQPVIIAALGGLALDGEDFVRGVTSVAGADVALFGGLSGDDWRFTETSVFTNGGHVTPGAVVLVLDGRKVAVSGIATSGWIGLGAEKIVTSSQGNVVRTIDNIPALDVYTRYLGIQPEDLPGIGVEYPMLVHREDNTSVLRAVVGVDHATRSLVFAGTVPQFARVRFSSSPGFEVVDYAKTDLASHHERNPGADFLLMFSCMARHAALGPIVEEEITRAHELWQCPLIGMFTYGEIGRNARGHCDFYNETCTLVTLREIR